MQSRLRHYRLERKLSQEDLGFAIGANQSLIATWELEGLPKAFLRVARAAQVLGISVDDLVPANLKLDAITEDE